MSKPPRFFGYPDDYRDPVYDGTISGTEWWQDVVLPARAKALERSLNEAFGDLLPPGTRFEMRPAGG